MMRAPVWLPKLPLKTLFKMIEIYSTSVHSRRREIKMQLQALIKSSSFQLASVKKHSLL